MKELDLKLKREREIFNANVNVHDLPDIFHYWANKFLRPLLEKYEISHPDDLFVKHMFASAQECAKAGVRGCFNYISIGSGNCDTEVRVAVRLRDMGLTDFCIECLDLSPSMLNRGKQLAVDAGVSEHLSFIETDLNEWRANKHYTSVIANQSLHHIENLERLFEQINMSLHPNGSFITSDMIGRNGHQRWPEALELIEDLWRELPESYKFNHQLNRLESKFVNWDCSTEGFEGVRAQDILPLLIQNFHFQFFVGYSNLIDIFIDRSFGHNFRIDNQWDTDFIDRVHTLDETLIKQGDIKPTHIMAVMKVSPVQYPTYLDGLPPEYCVRATQ
ncbi:MAG: class I SAM-dependent methyltransferase [Arenicella sp.]|nr:class I SAM-dependent methyltransferase [Arenicella sp.]